MLNEFKRAIAKARNKKQLDKILKKALEFYGLYSKRYGELLYLCWDKVVTF